MILLCSCAQRPPARTPAPALPTVAKQTLYLVGVWIDARDYQKYIVKSQRQDDRFCQTFDQSPTEPLGMLVEELRLSLLQRQGNTSGLNVGIQAVAKAYSTTGVGTAADKLTAKTILHQTCMALD